MECQFLNHLESPCGQYISKIIVNLPAQFQFLPNNIITCGIWVGQNKPDMHTLLSPILQRLDKLATIGFSFLSPEGWKTVRVKLLFGVFDLIAKAAVLNMKQFNGEHGCPTCLHPGERHSRTQTYPPSYFPIRTQDGIEKAIQEGKQRGIIIEGIKGPSPLTNYVHLVHGVPADYMHCVLEGVVKSLLKVWTDSKYYQHPSSLRRYLADIDNAFVQQRPPHEFTHPPRSIRSHLKYWKASEFRNWLLFYSLPLLLHKLPPLYFHYFALLVCSIHLLLQNKISTAMCNAAEEMLNDFYAQRFLCSYP